MNYPTIKWVRQQLRNNLISRRSDKVLSAYIVGSEAKGIATKQSDLDIAVIIPERSRVTALKITERYHAKFISERFKPHWQGRVVDFQFFYQLPSNYDKIEL